MSSSGFLFPRVSFKLTPYFCKASGHFKVGVWHFYHIDSVDLSLLPVHVTLFPCVPGYLPHVHSTLESALWVFYKAEDGGSFLQKTRAFHLLPVDTPASPVENYFIPAPCPAALP